LIAWIRDVRDYLAYEDTRSRRTEAQKISIASSYLAGDAKVKWGLAKDISDESEPGSPNKIETLEDFFNHVREANLDWNEQDNIRKRYMTLWQKQLAGMFGTELLLLARQLVPRPPEHE